MQTRDEIAFDVWLPGTRTRDGLPAGTLRTGRVSVWDSAPVCSAEWLWRPWAADGVTVDPKTTPRAGSQGFIESRGAAALLMPNGQEAWLRLD